MAMGFHLLSCFEIISGVPRPKTKTELLDAAEAQYVKLDSLIEGMSSDDQHTHFDPSITQIGKEAHWARDKTCATY
ncbi:ClbS/DfsB family four-helix bundle protein [Arcanobacterium hippocoleae]|uniref:ClbS/DfsB family four-helix bundle protein n=1 Tax=Arcanobacterium hippocoleae TaxID=149017 RepID=UPI00333E437A